MASCSFLVTLPRFSGTWSWHQDLTLDPTEFLLEVTLGKAFVWSERLLSLKSRGWLSSASKSRSFLWTVRTNLHMEGWVQQQIHRAAWTAVSPVFQLKEKSCNRLGLIWASSYLVLWFLDSSLIAQPGRCCLHWCLQTYFKTGEKRIFPFGFFWDGPWLPGWKEENEISRFCQLWDA